MWDIARRLQIKLEQKNKQIARDEHLLKTRQDENNEELLASLRHAIDEREEIKLLLDQVQGQIEKLDHPGQGTGSRNSGLGQI